MNENEYPNIKAKQGEEAAQIPVQDIDNTVSEADTSACIEASKESSSNVIEEAVQKTLEQCQANGDGDEPDDESEVTDEEKANEEEITNERNGYEKQLEERISVMQNRLDSICSQIEGQQKKLEKAMSDYNEFFGLYPDIDIKSIPDSVWESVNSGVPLAAAYALCERKKEVERQTAERINERNRTMSSGQIGSVSPQTYLSPAEVKAMSASEVRANLSLITESMKHWQ